MNTIQHVSFGTRKQMRLKIDNCQRSKYSAQRHTLTHARSIAANSDFRFMYSGNAPSMAQRQRYARELLLREENWLTERFSYDDISSP